MALPLPLATFARPDADASASERTRLGDPGVFFGGRCLHASINSLHDANSAAVSVDEAD